MRARKLPLFLMFAVAGGFLVPMNAAAQASGDGFLFAPPVVQIGVHGGYARANANSDVFADITDILTLSRSDFDSFSFGGSLAFRVLPRVDLSFSGSYNGRTATSESRDWLEIVGDEEVPIRQTTTFVRVPMTATAKYYVLPRGRRIGELAWIPARYSPYVGAGGGFTWYRLHQWGDFAEETGPDEAIVFADDFESSGWAPAARLIAGVDYSITEHIVVTGETNYLWSEGDLTLDFRDYEPIDLSGFSATVGVSLRI